MRSIKQTNAQRCTHKTTQTIARRRARGQNSSKQNNATTTHAQAGQKIRSDKDLNQKSTSCELDPK